MQQKTEEQKAASASSDLRAAVRSQVFHHMAGIVLAPTVKALWDRKVFHLFEGGAEWLTLDEVVEHIHGNRGYVRVALRLLASCGWLRQRIHGRSAEYALTETGRIAIPLAAPLFGEVISFIPKAVFLEDFLFGGSDETLLPSLQALVLRVKQGWGIGSHPDPATRELYERVRKFLDGMLEAPAMVALARRGVFAQIQQGRMDPGRVSANPASLGCIFDLLEAQGWMVRESGGVSLTSAGRYAADIATSYGVTVSYLPLMQVLSTLLFGNPRITRIDENGVELLVNRGMNVWGSGGAHNTYFKKVDEIVIELFNRPLDRQPQGICDMGCGDGTFLEHLYCVVESRTARGAVLDKHPLVLVGVDFNKVARRLAKQRLRKAAVPSFHVIAGDINRPGVLGGDLEHLGLDIHDLLHVRSFLDHNRPYFPPSSYAPESRTARASGAFSRLGDEIPPDELEENLVRHLHRWAPYVGRFGLLVLELHTLAPELTATNLDRTPAVGYDGTHGFSDQYLVELPIFLDCAREAGMHADLRHQASFPPSELATVSINFFRPLPTAQA